MSVTAPRSARRPPAETRNLMLDAIGQLLEKRAPWEIRASQVAAAAGTTQPNFYSHFRNIEDAIMARAEQVWGQYPTAELVDLLKRGLAENDDQPLEEFFAITIEFWRLHGGLLRAVSRLAGDENPAVRSVRHRAQDPLIDVCEAAVRRAQKVQDLSPALHSNMAGSAALRFLDEAAGHFQTMREVRAFSRDSILHTIVPMFRRLLTGR